MQITVKVNVLLFLYHFCLYRRVHSNRQESHFSNHVQETAVLPMFTMINVGGTLLAVIQHNFYSFIMHTETLGITLINYLAITIINVGKGTNVP